VFLRSISGVAFADYGGAFNQLDLDDPLESYHLGVGGELWFDLVLGYHVRGIIRFGHARGLDDEAPDGGQTYLVVGSAF
jgi:outer membrane translocation and assembly module TamA